MYDSYGFLLIFFFSSRRRHTRWPRDWSSDVCSSDLSSTSDEVGTPRAWWSRATSLAIWIAPRSWKWVSSLTPSGRLGYTPSAARSEEHTFELQSRGHLVCRLLLEKKKTHLGSILQKLLLQDAHDVDLVID